MGGTKDVHVYSINSGMPVDKRLPVNDNINSSSTMRRRRTDAAPKRATSVFIACFSIHHIPASFAQFRSHSTYRRQKE